MKDEVASRVLEMAIAVQQIPARRPLIQLAAACLRWRNL